MRYLKLFENFTRDNRFNKWFGQSKMVDGKGDPKVYYHGVGRAGKFNKFRKDLLGTSSGNLGHYGEGFYFAPTYKDAKIWSESMGGTGEVLEVYLKIENPFVVSRENLLALGEKYDLNIPSKKEVSIDKDSLIDGLKKIDPVSAEFLELITKKGYKEAWRIFIDSGKLDNAKLDLNDVSDWSEYLEYDEYRGVDEWVIEDIKELGIEPKINYDYPESIAMHYLTNLGDTASEWTKAIKSEGHDGIHAGDEIIVFEPNQIKSIDNKGSFNASIDDIYESLNEGLTKSYDSDKAVRFIVNNSKFTDSDIWISEAQNGTEYIKISVKFSNMNDAERMFKMLENVYGWFISNIVYDLFDDFDVEEMKDFDYSYLDEILVDEDDELTFTFEKKFDKEYKGADTTLYHITDEKYLSKIQRVGLVPKSQTKLTIHPERIYFTLTYKGVEELLKNKNFILDDVVILEVDISDLDIKLYYDPNMPDAVYTMNNIPPKNIKIKE